MAHQGYIEPHACTATINESGQATVWCCTQGHFEFRAMTSKILDMNVADLKFIASEIGGGFGGKTVVYLEPVAILLSKKVRSTGEDDHVPGRGLPGHRTEFGHPLQS